VQGQTCLFGSKLEVNNRYTSAMTPWWSTRWQPGFVVMLGAEDCKLKPSYVVKTATVQQAS
jgi:hypothetical protein